MKVRFLGCLRPPEPCKYHEKVLNAVNYSGANGILTFGEVAYF